MKKTGRRPPLKWGDECRPSIILLRIVTYKTIMHKVVDKIEVDRYIITSSQQYESTKEYGKYLRESVVCLKK
jgi:hypothetical protein